MDTLTYNGLEQTLAAWGFDRDTVKQTRYNKREDTFTGFIGGSSVSNPVFTFEAPIIVRNGRSSATGVAPFSGGVIKFQGKTMPPVAAASGAKQGTTQTVLGPWYDLANNHFLQTFKGFAANPYAPGETILNTGITPTGTLLYISVGDQIQAILQWLLDQYKAQGFAAPYQYVGRALNPGTGTIDYSTNGNAGMAGINTDKSGDIYVYQLPANGLTIDQALYGTFLVSYITKPLMCSQALQKMLELSPRTNIVFDHTTTPPTCYVRSIDNFTPVSIPILDGASNKTLNIKRRDDLVARAVNINYRITNTVNGATGTDYAQDKWGPNGSNSALDPNAGLRVLVETLDLQGYSVNGTQAQIDCEPLALIGGTGLNATKRAWWSSRRGGEQAKLLDSRLRFQEVSPAGILTQSQIPDATLTYATTSGTDLDGNPRVAGQPLSALDLGLFSDRIVQGTYHDWMADGANPVYSLKVRAQIIVQHATYDAVATGDTLNQLPGNETASDTAQNGVRQGLVSGEPFHVDLQLTNATNPGPGEKFTASITASFTAGELFIIGNGGIAQYLFNALQKKQYEGEAVKVESDFSNSINMTNAVNFTGGLPEWTTMNAQIQSITEDYGTKETFVKIGVANHLNAGQLSSLLNMWAFRRPWYNPQLRANNLDNAGNSVQMPDNSGGANSTTGVKTPQAVSFTNYLTPPTGQAPGVAASAITVDPLHLTLNDALNN